MFANTFKFYINSFCKYLIYIWKNETRIEKFIYKKLLYKLLKKI